MKNLIIAAAALSALLGAAEYEPNRTCKTCHPAIYDEYYGSAHRNASIFNDPVHKALWDRHPLKKKQKYVCAECHTPTDKKVTEALASNESAVPKKSAAQTQEAVSCAYCHRISSIEEHAKSNKNIISTQKRKFYSARLGKQNSSDVSYKMESSFFGLFTEKSGSPFHKIDFSNQNYYNGKVCMGCHSHKQNSHGLDLCRMETEEGKDDKNNCITCHMPLVQGSFTTVTDSKTHRYHGFAGSLHKPQMLAKYVKLSLEKSGSGFDIIIKNEANHQLLLHPLRVGELRITIIRDGKNIDLKPYKFIRLIGKDSKPAMPWIADSVLKDNHIKAKEARRIHFSDQLEKGDVVEVKLGHYNVNPKVAKKLRLENQSDLSGFKLLKKERFVIQ